MKGRTMVERGKTQIKNHSRRLLILAALISAAVLLWQAPWQRLDLREEPAVTPPTVSQSLPLQPEHKPIPAHAPTAERLSVGETIGLVFLRRHEGPSQRHLYCSANPEALGAIRHILNDSQNEMFHSVAWDILSYIGTADDVPRLRKLLFQESEGHLWGAKGSALRAAFYALGVWCRRDIPAARSLVDELCHYETWSRVNYHWVPVGVAYELTEAQQNMTYMLAGYALSGKSDVEDRCQQAIDEITDLQNRAVFERSLREYMKGSKQAIELERRPITADERLMLSRAWNGDMENPGPAKHTKSAASDRPVAVVPAVNPPAPIAKEDPLLKEAVTAFAAICQLVRDGDADQLGTRLLDNAKPIAPARKSGLTDELRGDLPRLLKLIDDASVREAKPVNATITRDDLKADDGDVTIRYELAETSKIGIDLARQTGGFNTVANGGNLLVLLKRIDGVWFWNPFGW